MDASIEDARPVAISPLAWESRRTLRAAFQSNDPLGGFVIVPNFLRSDIYDELRSFATHAPMRRYCVFSRSGSASDLEKGFHEPVKGFHYLTIHSRLFPQHGVPTHFEDMVSSREMIGYLSALSGVALSGHQVPGTLTGWNPGDFLGQHTDEGDQRCPNRLVVSLSLTGDWSEAFGGVTNYRWLGDKRDVSVVPNGNFATIFAPGEHSIHWVSELYETAPKGRRFTWTLDYF